MSDDVTVLYAVFEGRMPDGTYVGYSLWAPQDTEPEMLEDLSQCGVKVLEMRYPGVRDAAQLGTWAETVLPEEEQG